MVLGTTKPSIWRRRSSEGQHAGDAYFAEPQWFPNLSVDVPREKYVDKPPLFPLRYYSRFSIHYHFGKKHILSKSYAYFYAHRDSEVKYIKQPIMPFEFPLEIVKDVFHFLFNFIGHISVRQRI